MQIETERLILRNYKKTDINDYWEYVQMPNVGPRCGWEPHKSIEQAKERLDLEITKSLQFAIVLKSENKVIGSIELMEPDKNTKGNGKCKEIGCLLSEHYWGKGITTEAGKEVVKFLFNEVGYNRIQARFMPVNIGSGKVMEKLGMKYEGTQRDMAKDNKGNFCDIAVYSILKREFKGE